VPPQ
jgi:hypothetical protein